MYDRMWIKICGITSAEDARVVSSSGAAAIGLNFYPASKRYLSPDALPEVRAAVSEDMDVVGVFVNATTETVRQLTETARLDTVQFHGDETPEQVQQFQQACPDTHIIRAFRIGDAGFSAADTWLQRAAQLGVSLQSVLIDAYHPGEYGGTGHQIRADLVNAWHWPRQPGNRFILAGGLRPDNVAAAISATAPFGVDTASGVEDSPGVKNATAVRAFVRNVGIPSEPPGNALP
ncbi:MAG: phosphoribosylanthranilate isomerase [Planctomycetaceae bacterium]|nr:phosphoribosylanthranilate isomerase [Planctomycetaceae bacterium]